MADQDLEEMVIRAAQHVLERNDPYLDSLPGARGYWTNLANGRTPKKNDFIKAAEVGDVFGVFTRADVDRLLEAGGY